MHVTTRVLPLVLLGIALGACSEDNEPATSNQAASAGDNGAGESETEAAEPASEPESTPEASEPEPEPEADTEEASGGGTCDDVNFTPKCDLAPTAAGDEIKKGAACTAEDPECCWRSCGPQSIGWKTETCLAGFYEEGDCQFPADADYSCFAIPDEIDAEACPRDAPPQATGDCDVAECILCNLDDTYLDSKGSAKVGFCVCQPPNSDGKRTWSCGSSTAWPCPLGQGC